MGVRKAAGEVDAKIAAKIRLRRVELKMSQDTLGQQLGVSAQQVQKYETGRNRIAVSQLMEIAEALQMPFGYFVEDLGLSTETGQTHLSGQTRMDAAKLMSAFLAIPDRKMQAAALQIVQRIAVVAEFPSDV